MRVFISVLFDGFRLKGKVGLQRNTNTENRSKQSEKNTAWLQLAGQVYGCWQQGLLFLQLAMCQVLVWKQLICLFDKNQSIVNVHVASQRPRL